MKKLLYILFFITMTNLFGQDCPDLLSPTNGATNVPVDSVITWEDITGVTGYIISLGTSSGGTDIVNNQATGAATTFIPTLGLPENTQIFVTITLFFIDQPEIVCPSQSFTTENVTTVPDCTQITTPTNGATNVNSATLIFWSYAPRATGYRITIETGIGLGDIENNLNVGNVLQFNPTPDLPFDTEIFVTIIPFNQNGEAVDCITESFTTGPAAILPSCTTIISPADGAIGIPLTPLIEWTVVPDAAGYRLFIGRSPTENDVLDGGVFFTTSTFVLNFEPNSVYFIRIIPFNDAGDAIGCEQTSFATLLGCGPFFDADTGELVIINPELTLPETIGICLNEVPLILEAPDAADGFRWYQYNINDQAFIISDDSFVTINDPGIYIYEAYTYTNADGDQLECASSMYFEVVASEAPQLISLNVSNGINGLNVIVNVEGIGDYEYAIDEVGTYQDSNTFTNIPEDKDFIFVRDKNGCGSISIDLSNYRTKEGFPLFFTPNQDSFNDYWQYKASSDDDFVLEVIYVYDRFGKLVKSIDPKGPGWDGTLKGENMPTATFWYQALASNGQIFKGYFTLKR